MIKIPIADWLPTYNKTLFKGDLIAGLTVGVMLIPQGMAYAMIAGLEPIYGLYASIVPLILYAIFGTTRQLAVGPVAMISLLVAAGAGAIANSQTSILQIALTLALMVGVLQLLLGIFRLGFLVNFLSRPVISGFSSAAALIIGLSQVKHLISADLSQSTYVHEIILEAIRKVNEHTIINFSVGLGGALLIIFAKKYLKKIPAALLVIVCGILVAWGFGLTEKGLNVVEHIPKGLPAFGVPNVELSELLQLLPIALTIALVAFMQSIAVSKAIQAQDNSYKVIPNQELIALGLTNIGGAFFQAYPTTGSFSRTAINAQAGAKTGIASLISAIFMIITLLFLTPLFFFLPKAILASIIMVAVFAWIDVKEAKKLWSEDRRDFWMLIVTFAGTIVFGIEQGILIGVVLSLVMMIYQTAMPHIAVLGKVPNSTTYRNLARFEDLENRADILILRFDARLYFANVNHFKESIGHFIEEKGRDLKLFILDADSINAMDSSGVYAIKEIIRLCKEKNIQFYITGMKGPVRDVFQKTNLFEKMGKNSFFLQIQHGVDCYDKKGGQKYRDYTLEYSD